MDFYLNFISNIFFWLVIGGKRMKYAQRGATKFTRFSRSRNDFARTSHCARGTSPSIVVHNVAGAEAARLENYEGAFSTSLSVPPTLFRLR